MPEKGRRGPDEGNAAGRLPVRLLFAAEAKAMGKGKKAERIGLFVDHLLRVAGSS